MWWEVAPHLWTQCSETFSIKLTWFNLMVSRFRTCFLRAAEFEDDNLKILDIKPGFG